MIPPELMSMAFGSLTGFIFKFMAQRAKEKAEKLFSIQTMWDNYVKLYTEIMSR